MALVYYMHGVTTCSKADRPLQSLLVRGTIYIAILFAIVWEDQLWWGITYSMIDHVMHITPIGIKDIDGQLGAYPYESLKTWYSLTNHITEPLMKRLV